MSLDSTLPDRTVSLPPVARRGAVAVVAAVAATAVVLAVGRALLAVPPGFEPLQWRPVLVTSAAGALGGAVVYGVLDRFTARTDGAFLVVAGLVLLASFVPLVTSFLGAVAPAVVGLVALLHVTVAVVTVGALVDASNLARPWRR